MKVLKNTVTSFFIMCSAVFYAVVTAAFPNAYFRDRDNYISYATDSATILSSYDSLLLVLVNEPLFLLLNAFFSLFLPAELVPAVFVFFIAFTLFYILVKKAKNALLAIAAVMLIFFTAQVFHLQLVVLRQGVATSLFMWLAYFLWQKKSFYLLLPVLGFIHSSFFIVAAVFYADKFTTLFIGRKIFIRLLMQIILGLAVSLVGLYIAAILGVRQASADHVMGPVAVGGGNFILWSLVLVTLMSLSTKKLMSDPFYIIALLGLAFYLSMYFLSPISGRLIAAFLPFCVAAITMSLSGRVLFVLLFVLVVNFMMFFSVIEGNSLTDSGVQYLSSYL